MRWIWLAAAAAVLGWWWWRRHKAMAGTANTTGAPAGASPSGVAAAVATGAGNRFAGSYLDQREQAAALSKLSYLHEVGFGLVTPMQVMNASKPLPAPTVQPPKPRLNTPPNGCAYGKKPTKLTTGSTTRTECR